MKKMYLGIALAFFLLLSGINLNAQSQGTLKVGIVNLQTILNELPSAKDAEKRLQSLAKTYQDSLLNMQSELQQRFQSYQKQQGMMTQENKQKEEQELQELQMKMRQFEQQKFGAQGELQQMRQNLIEPITDEVIDAIEEVASNEEINLVFDESAQAVLYSEDEYDMTYRVLDHLKRGKKGKESK